VVVGDNLANCLFCHVRLVIFSLLTLLCYDAPAQALLKGLVKNQNGEPLAFANVFIKGTQHGTTTNELGKYELRCDTGEQVVVFQFVGHKQHTEVVNLGSKTEHIINAILHEQSYNINEVKITATAEDPAYPIMRQAIAHRNIYLKEARAYRCKVYIKGMQRLTTIPKRVLLMKVPEDIKPGIIYLSESLSEYSFMQPNLVKEKLISSKVSGDNRAFSFNRAGAVRFNVYENILPAYGLNQRGFVSPLADNALFYYKFKLEGETKENNYTIYKIRIIPKRNSDPVFRGYIYIVKDSWRVHSTDMAIDKSANIEFVDTLIIRQMFAPQNGGVWMPISQRFIFQLEVLGFKGHGYFVALYSDYDVKSSYPPTFYGTESTKLAEDNPVPQLKKVPKAKPPVEPKKERKQQPEELSEKDFTREVLSINKQANQTPDSVWEAIRPVPLTEEESEDYKTKDSIQVVKESKPYKDSIDRLNNKPDWLDPILTGYTYSDSYRKLYYSFKPFLAQLQYNTVEGAVLSPTVDITRTYEDERRYNISPTIRYGFTSKRWYGKVEGEYLYNPYKLSQWNLSAGHYVSQFNRNEPISPAINTYYSVMEEQNFMKLYQETFLQAGWKSEILNGVMLNTSLHYAKRSPLQNTTNYAWRYLDERIFTPNTPVNTELADASFTTHQALTLEAETEIKFAQRYISRPYEKIRFSSKYPTLLMGVRAGIPLAGSDVNYAVADIGTRIRKSFRLYGVSYLKIHAGAFLYANQLYFMDYHHFTGNQTLFALSGYDSYQLLDYYRYSTRDRYLEARYNHHFNGFWFNKIPLIRRLKWQEVFTLNYFKTPASPHYVEWGAGIEHIFKIMRVDYFQAFGNGTYLTQGIRIGVGF
jgi:hypothetical protein